MYNLAKNVNLTKKEIFLRIGFIISGVAHARVYSLYGCYMEPSINILYIFFVTRISIYISFLVIKKAILKKKLNCKFSIILSLK